MGAQPVLSTLAQVNDTDDDNPTIESLPVCPFVQTAEDLPENVTQFAFPAAAARIWNQSGATPGFCAILRF